MLRRPPSAPYEQPEDEPEIRGVRRPALESTTDDEAAHSDRWRAGRTRAAPRSHAVRRAGPAGLPARPCGLPLQAVPCPVKPRQNGRLATKDCPLYRKERLPDSRTVRLPGTDRARSRMK